MRDRRDEIRNAGCDLCPLHEGAQHRCLMGAGKTRTKIMVVGEAPGAREDEEHRAFVGPAGQLLTELLHDAGIPRDTVYITNAAKCRPPDNRTPTRKEMKVCVANYFIPELEMVKPEFVLLLGNAALQGIAGKSGITKHRGQVYKLGDVTLFPTYHPAFVLRDPNKRPDIEADFHRFARITRGEKSDVETTIRIVRTRAQLKWLRSQLMQATEISFDIENLYKDGKDTFGEWHPKALITSIAFTWDSGASAVVPINHVSSPWKNPHNVLEVLRPCLERPGIKYIAHNGKHDCKWLAQWGIRVPQTFDTMLAAHMLDENRHKGLKPLSQTVLGADAYGVGEDKEDTFNMPLKRLCVYNGKDTDYTYRLYHIFRDQLREEIRTARVFAKLMMPASNALVDVERTGIWVNNERLDRETANAEQARERMMAKLLKHVPKSKRATINFNSPPQVGKWLFGDLKLQPLEQTKTGADSTNESVMLRLAKEHPAPALLLEYRTWTKRLNTYLEPWKRRQDAHGRIHTTYKLYGTVTGRLSSVEPNLQQVPRESTMRTVFGAEPGWLFVEADYSQIELRIAAMVANERRMLRQFAAGEDIHLLRAMRMTGKRAEDVTKEERKKAKAVNFGFLYGMMEQKFVIYARDNYGVDVSEDEAHEAREGFFRDYPALVSWHARQRRLVHRYGQVSSPIGRVRHLPTIKSGDKEVVREAERQAINSPVQSCASDLMLMALIMLHGHPHHGKRFRVVGTVHDQLLFEAREKHLQSTLQLIESTMRSPPTKRLFGLELTVPIEVDILVGTHWAEGEKWTR